MELSAKVEYALVALMELANQSDLTKPLQLKHIAERHSIPDRYLEQVFMSLRQASLVNSQRGNRGGYLLAREPWQITVLEVFSSLEDPRDIERSSSSQSTDRSIVREVWKEAHQSAKAVLQRYTLRDLCQQQEVRQRLSGMYYI